MKLFKNIIIACSVATGKNPKTSYCDLGELNLPDNAEKWVCGEATGNFIPIRSKCYLECDAGYIATSFSKRSHQKCLSKGWLNPGKVDVRCQRDVNELENELAALKNSLINNNLLDSCTIQGETNDWFQYTTEIVAVEVDLSSSNITKIDRINTFLTSPTLKPQAIGSNNIQRVAGEDLKFLVGLRKDKGLTIGGINYDVEWSKKTFTINYEVGGPCA